MPMGSMVVSKHCLLGLKHKDFIRYFEILSKGNTMLVIMDLSILKLHY